MTESVIIEDTIDNEVIDGVEGWRWAEAYTSGGAKKQLNRFITRQRFANSTYPHDPYLRYVFSLHPIITTHLCTCPRWPYTTTEAGQPKSANPPSRWHNVALTNIGPKRNVLVCTECDKMWIEFIHNFIFECEVCEEPYYALIQNPYHMCSDCDV